MIKKNINLLSNTVNQSEQNEKKVYISETSMLSNLRFPETILDLNTLAAKFICLYLFFFLMKIVFQFHFGEARSLIYIYMDYN